MRLIFIEIGKQIIAPKIKHISIPVVHVTSMQIMIENIRNTIRQILKYDFKLNLMGNYDEALQAAIGGAIFKSYEEFIDYCELINNGWKNNE